MGLFTNLLIKLLGLKLVKARHDTHEKQHRARLDRRDTN